MREISTLFYIHLVLRIGHLIRVCCFNCCLYYIFEKRYFHLPTTCFIFHQILGGKSNHNLRMGVQRLLIFLCILDISFPFGCRKVIFINTVIWKKKETAFVSSPTRLFYTYNIFIVQRCSYERFEILIENITNLYIYKILFMDWDFLLFFF